MILPHCCVIRILRPDQLVDRLLERYLDNIAAPQNERARFIHTFDMDELAAEHQSSGMFGTKGVRARRRKQIYFRSPRTARYIQRNLQAHGDLAKYGAVLQDYIVGPALSCSSQYDVS